jgi:hypothetical protein
MPKRNYIRRKKCLNDSTSLVKSTLHFINRTLGTDVDPDEVDRIARHHAAAIEAVCWDPRTSRLTDNIYHSLMVSKTRELCIALIVQSLPEPSAVQFVRELGNSDFTRQQPLRPAMQIPMPILARPTDALDNDTDLGERDTEGFGEMPRLKFEHADLFYEGDGCHDAMGRWATE